MAPRRRRHSRPRLCPLRGLVVDCARYRAPGSKLCQRHQALFLFWIHARGGLEVYEHGAPAAGSEPAVLRRWKRETFKAWLEELGPAEARSIVEDLERQAQAAGHREGPTGQARRLLAEGGRGEASRAEIGAPRGSGPGSGLDGPRQRRLF